MSGLPWRDANGPVHISVALEEAVALLNGEGDRESLWRPRWNARRLVDGWEEESQILWRWFTDKQPSPEDLRKARLDLERCESPAEVMSLLLMLATGKVLHVSVRQPIITQAPFGPYRLDFSFPSFIPRAGGWTLCDLEIDGRDYHSTPEQLAHDAARDRYVSAAGLYVERFPASWIFLQAWEVTSRWTGRGGPA